ncbi:alpha/beta hydrolase-fold protein [Bacillus sp. DX1.1]|uniref:alpha/beta hydrolase n=1 Tax=unclassified Bacillus (in: firmicutes) TaxID=185979 RepID=UPI00256FC37F|nr:MULTISPECIES: alpha/beta hydrolase-fold protein [unclassified Bacillus (in: firmicutes)]MDM5155911.1 alpha/beta hydrolase-fold protein [Bacillus sp. DX1.1]WJE80205.1 alpha/beta hydrolase-fold protein [Bacillus sp. DX3.1]
MNFSIEKQDAIISNTEQWNMHSKKDNRQYQIYVSKPKQPAPPSGYPVIYVLDGNAFFQTFQEAVRVQSVRSEKTGVIPAIIVGIGYPVEENFAAAYRFYDFTLPSSSLTLPPRPDGKPWPKTGGANVFFDFIQEELKPQINKQFQIDCKRQTIFGHSLGGLFALYVLFTNINAFQTYFISSPSIWWNNQSILEKESAFINELDKVDSEIGVFLTVGSLEKDHMVLDANALSERLVDLQHSRLRFAFHEADGENHASVIPTVLSRALRFVFNQ